MTEEEARLEICRVGRSLFERGFVHATSGNISVKLDETVGGGYLITPTDACLGFLDPERLARLDETGNQISGDKGSKSISLHKRIYEASSPTKRSAKCVIHTHSTNCVALTLAKPSSYFDGSSNSYGELLPPLTPYFVMKVGHVPVIKYHRPGDPKVGEVVSSVITEYMKSGSPIRAVMLERLGPNVWGDSPSSAMAVLEELEETAKLWFLTRGLPERLSSEQIIELSAAFDADW